MELSEDVKKELLVALYRHDNALSRALLNHYCKAMEVILCKPSEEIKAEILLEKERLIDEHQKTLNLRN